MPAKQRGNWPKVFLKLKEQERASFFSPSENRCLLASTPKPEEREFVVDSGASMHMISKKDLNEAEMHTLTKWCSPTVVITANGEVQTHEEAAVSVKELDIFLTMKVLENTSAVLSLGKLCDENGFSGEFRSDRGFQALSTSFVLRILSVNFKDTFKTGESLFYIFFKLVFITDRQHRVIMRLEKERIELK